MHDGAAAQAQVVRVVSEKERKRRGTRAGQTQTEMGEN